MRIAVSADGPDLKAGVGDRFGLAKYLIVVDTETMAFEAVPNPGPDGQRGAGIQAVVLVISRKVDTVLTSYISPTAKVHLTTNGIEVLTGVRGMVAEVLKKYETGDLPVQREVEHSPRSRHMEIDTVNIVHAFKSSARQFAVMAPILTGVVLIIGILNALMSEELISDMFLKNPVLDTFWGAYLGSILAGNPINSYVIGGTLLEYGVSLFAVTAFIIAWVTVGVVQLPAEIAALGKRFALARNSISFVLSIAISFVTVVLLNFITG
ncbi:NifB/NifX family molybdenum-iron cluster-binding protein [Thermodesulfobacteriota bacterium]